MILDLKIWQILADFFKDVRKIVVKIKFIISNAKLQDIRKNLRHLNKYGQIR